MYTTTDLTRMTGASYRQIDMWIRQGLLTPAGQGQRSRSRLFSHDDAVRAVLLASLLRDLGVTALVAVDILAGRRTFGHCTVRPDLAAARRRVTEYRAQKNLAETSATR